ncbi:MAG: FAD-dependent oxidoreductase [Spirochaetes bacterium]|nr:FAD-dependent oxidoreductase [Spirochaetota bacterium]
MAIVKKYRSEVAAIENPVADIYMVSLRSLEKRYKYSPGQFLHLALDGYDPSFPWPESRCFSMQSHQEEEMLKITFAVKGAFTGRMARELAAGREVWVKLPYGELFSREHRRENTVFIAGGTGITPFLSIFTSPAFGEYRNPRLHFGYRDDRYHSLYRDELDAARRINPTFTVEAVDQETEGMLDIAKIYGAHGNDPAYFISGPPAMIKSFKEYLLARGVPETEIRTDDWE